MVARVPRPFFLSRLCVQDCRRIYSLQPLINELARKEFATTAMIKRKPKPTAAKARTILKGKTSTKKRAIKKARTRVRAKGVRSLSTKRIVIATAKGNAKQLKRKFKAKKLKVIARKLKAKKLKIVARKLSVAALEEVKQLKAGILNTPFQSAIERAAWYKDILKKKADEAHRKKWEPRTSRALARLEKLKAPRLLMKTVRSYLRKNLPGGPSSLTGMPRENVIELYKQLREKKHDEKLLVLAKNCQAKKHPDLSFSSDEELLKWYKDMLQAEMQKKAQAEARRHFKKGQLSFSPMLASNQLISTWYTLRNVTAAGSKRRISIS